MVKHVTHTIRTVLVPGHVDGWAGAGNDVTHSISIITLVSSLLMDSRVGGCERGES